MVNDCRECASGRPHCHGTLISHPGQRAECTEPDCEHPDIVLHALRVDCEVIGCECGHPAAHRWAV